MAYEPTFAYGEGMDTCKATLLSGDNPLATPAAHWITGFLTVYDVDEFPHGLERDQV